MSGGRDEESGQMDPGMLVAVQGVLEGRGEPLLWSLRDPQSCSSQQSPHVPCELPRLEGEPVDLFLDDEILSKHC